MERLVLLSLLFVCIQAVYSQSQPWIGNLSAYEIASFKNPVQVIQIVKTQLDHFFIHPDTGDIYIGAVNYIYRLDENLVQVVNVSTATGAGEQYVNYNKILVLQGGRLITCGSERNPAMRITWCASRNEDDLLEDGLTGQNDFEVAAFGNYTTESIVAPGLYNGARVSRLYVVTSYCEEGCQYWSVPPVSRRLLVAGEGFMFANIDDDSVELYRLAFAFFPISYVSSFIWKEFTYFVSFRREDAGDARHVSKMSRVCHDSHNLDSYTEILIQCDSQAGNNMYSLVQAAHVEPAGPDLSQSLSLNADEEVLYAVFAKNGAYEAVTDVPQPKKGSALCIYKMSDIEAAFEAAVEGCLTIGNTYAVGYLENNRCPGSSTVKMLPTDCKYSGSSTSWLWLIIVVFCLQPPINPGLYCDAMSLYKYADGITPVVSTAVLELPDHLTSSILTSIELDHTVAFIGTTEAQLLKVHIESGSSARLYEQIPIPFDDDLKGFTANPVKRDMKINDATGELHLLTEQKLVKMRVENCGQYTTCETCIGTDAEMDGDPYCGWCTLQRQCTRYNECPLQDVSSRWLSYNDPQCIEITDIAPDDSHIITVAEQRITLTVQQLPDLLNSQHYNCNFDDVFSNQANKSGDTLQCTTPPSNLILEIMMGDDSSSMLLSVDSTETGVNFVNREFSFYKCSIHKSCVSCVASRWACDWCVFENRCTHESTSTCSGINEVIVTGQNNKGTSMQGPDSCPQLQIQEDEILVSTGVDRQIIVLTGNLPDPEQIKSYQCSLNIEGAKQSATATHENDVLTCEENSYTYVADEQDLNVDLTVEWTDTNDRIHLLDDRYGFKVRLYKCESLRPDCSRCVSEVTTNEELGCVWCDGTCAVTDSTVCLMTNSMVTRDNGLNCPDPVIEEIFPLTGPVNGNTILTLYGTDFGRRFSDIQAVIVGGRICDFAELEMYYLTGSSVTCLIRNNPDNQAPQELIVYVTGLNGDLQTGSGDVSFGYKVPSITSFSPRFGPAAGGTRITINGMALNTGRNIQAFIGDKACNIISTFDESALCISPMGSVGATGMLQMSFDGVVADPDQNYTFTNNPGITKVSPTTSIIAGGRTMIVQGTYLDTTQMASLAVTIATSITPNPMEFMENCSVQSGIMMTCKTPNITSAISSSSSQLNVTFGFIMDGVSDLITWSQDNDVDLEFFPDPEYDKFPNDLYEKTDATIKIEGININSAITVSEVIVYVGTATCFVYFINELTLRCDLPDEQLSAGDFNGQNTERGLPEVVVMHSNLEFRIGYVSYPQGSVIISVASSVIFIILICVIIVLAIRLLRSKRRVNLLVLQKDFLEEIKRGIPQRKMDIFQLTSDVEESGMPFVGHRDYATNMLFIGQEVRPTTTDQEYCEESVIEEAMMKFSKLLGNKNFLLIFIQTLDTGSRSKMSVKERQSIASLLTVTMVLNNKLDVLTHVLTTLMAQMIQDAHSTDQELLLFSKTDSVLEKLLSNWVALCLYDQLKNHTAYPLFVLYRAIKYRTEQGPIDAVTGQAEFSLNFENLLQEDLDFNILTLVVLNKEGTIIKEVKVLDVDTISQVKEKILDALHLNKPYSSRPSANQVSLVWHRGENGRLVLTDKCVRPVDNNCCRIATLKDFAVPDKAEVTLVDKGQAVAVVSSSGPVHQFEVEITREYFAQETLKDLHPALEVESTFTEEGGYCIPTKGSIQQKIPPDKPQVKFQSKVPDRTQEKGCEGESAYAIDGFEDEDQNIEGVRDWHLARGKESFSVEYHSTKQRGRTSCCVSSNEHSQWAAYRIPIQRVLLSKIIIQEYVDNMFQTILCVKRAPKAIKFLFDFFDKQALLCDTKSKDPEIKFAWKNNILPLRFWSNAIKHPDYIFDINLSPSVEASMQMIGQLFHDAHDTKTGKPGQESSVNKFLYSRERTKYQRLVRQYYKGVEESTPVTTQDLNTELQKASQNFTGLFSKLNTLKQLWDILLVVLKTKDQSDQEHLGCLLEEVKETLSSGHAL
ncbi:plexin-B-like [Asterias rubens]|uniref:plexin-B-like n=1 Tax=Asterias rubens TaxID=7604 RepID=UPI001455BBA2|nr:plexin-B-like [Asterias rubens]